MATKNKKRCKLWRYMAYFWGIKCQRSIDLGGHIPISGYRLSCKSLWLLTRHHYSRKIDGQKVLKCTLTVRNLPTTSTNFRNIQRTANKHNRLQALQTHNV